MLDGVADTVEDGVALGVDETVDDGVALTVLLGVLLSTSTATPQSTAFSLNPIR